MADAQTRVYADRDQMIPRALVRGVMALVLASLAIATFASVTDRPPVSTPPVAPVKAEASLVFESNAASGAATVWLADGTLLADLDPEAGGFIAGVHRVILRERTKHRVAFARLLAQTQGGNT